jgi:RNA polymerase sigma factor (sigma-70 family)
MVLPWVGAGAKGDADWAVVNLGDGGWLCCEGERLERLKKRSVDGAILHLEEWAALYWQESPRLNRFIRSKTWGYRNEDELRRDVEQETWKRLIERIGPAYEFPVLTFTFMCWWALAARNAVLGDVVRFDGGQGDVDPELDILIRLESAASDSEQRWMEDFLALLDKSKPALMGLEHKIVVMRFVNEMTFKELGEALGATVGMVSGAYYRALRKIRRGIIDAGVEKGEAAGCG